MIEILMKLLGKAKLCGTFELLSGHFMLLTISFLSLSRP